MSKANDNKLEELRARIKNLEEDNSFLSENKEELLLLGLISEQVEFEKDEHNLLSAVLEKISILKDVPFCASFSLNSNSAQLICSYSALQESEIKNEQVHLSDQLISVIKNGAEIIDLEKKHDFCLIKNTDVPFHARAAIVIPFVSRYILKGLFLFLFDRQNKKEISSQLILLQRVVEMTVSKIENISLVRELKKINTELDQKIQEKTRELLDSNKNLKIQIEEQKQLKAQFYQSQKMEAIGKLAGGIAHDFNNLLTIINGYSELLLLKFDKSDLSYAELEQINIAGKRAANLTNQLLAFSRKQVIKPVVINLNDVVLDSEKMLQRLIGEDISLQTILDPSLGTMKADSGQLIQIIMNLAVNARDAMPKGGNITIKTKKVHVTKEELLPEIEMKPGNYCYLSVTDNGSGMDEEIQAQIFEPFYTTKDKSEGTGLGLSTVFGIIKQNNGFIKVSSILGEGSTFHIYLPSVDETSKSNKSKVSEPHNARNVETILIVEDDLHVQKLTESILQRAGYSLLTANNAAIGLQLIEDTSNNIDLLLTDVILPGLSGSDLALKSRKILPGIKVLFMSGYTDDIIAKHGILTEEIEYIQKPFTSHSLIKSVREVLDKEF